jgi:hypothetical protein
MTFVVVDAHLLVPSLQASRFAARNGWPLTHLPRQLDQLIRQGQYTDAATLIFRTPLPPTNCSGASSV